MGFNPAFEGLNKQKFPLEQFQISSSPLRLSEPKVIIL